LQQGGYEVTLGEAYSAKAQYAIRSYGKYLMALSQDRLMPLHPEEVRFVAVVNGEQAPKDDAEKGWLRFLREYPEFRDD
jgi:uncharacterized protein YifE (UPF0438 family)